MTQPSLKFKTETPTPLYQRSRDIDRLVHDELTPGCEWVLRGEGTSEPPHAPTLFAELSRYFRVNMTREIVWRHADGRVVRVTRQEFGWR